MLHAELANSDFKAFAYSLFALCAWTTIYALRGITEERHLLMGNNGYAEYMQRVKWRFIPRVL
jgi:protein-S-isoprenylcysteine O-methyltransferase Ste14